MAKRYCGVLYIISLGTRNCTLQISLSAPEKSPYFFFFSQTFSIIFCHITYFYLYYSTVLQQIIKWYHYPLFHTSLNISHIFFCLISCYILKIYFFLLFYFYEIKCIVLFFHFSFVISSVVKVSEREKCMDYLWILLLFNIDIKTSSVQNCTFQNYETPKRNHKCYPG